MKTRKSTKRALIVSCLSLLLCVSMLVGSTMAWFTDNATTNVNTIKSGKLDIQLLAANDKNAASLEGETLAFIKAAGHEDKELLFEPGAKYKLTDAWLYNAGNLHVKYQVVISGINGDSELAKVLDVYVNEEYCGTLMDLATTGEGIVKPDKTLAPGAFDTFGTIELMMQTTAGNEYQGKTLSGIAITVHATQATVEYDSEDNQYDAGAEYDPYAGYAVVSVTSQEGMEEALTNATADEPTVITLSGDADTYKFPTWTEYSGSLNGKTIVFKANGDKTLDATFFNVNGTQNLIGANLIIDGVNIDFPASSWMSNGYTGMNLAGGSLTIKNATVSGAQYLYVPTAEFINCVFETTTDSYSVCTYGAANVAFTGCTFNTAGKAVLLYHDGNVTTNVTLTDCKFHSDATAADDKAAVETGDSPAQGSKFDITFENCEATGFVANNSTSNLWGNKVNSNMPTDRLNVVIDGTDVY